MYVVRSLPPELSAGFATRLRLSFIKQHNSSRMSVTLGLFSKPLLFSKRSCKTNGRRYFEESKMFKPGH